MKFHPKYLLVFLLIMVFDLFAHAGNPDSLLTIVTSGKGEEAALACAGLSVQYRNTNSDSAIFYAQKGVDMAKKAGSDDALVRCYLELGNSYLSIDSLDAAEKYLKEAENHFTSDADTAHMISVCKNLVSIYAIRQDYYQAMNHNLLGLELAKKNNNKPAISKFYNNMGVIERNVGLTDDALKHYRLVLSMLSPDEKNQRCGTIGNIGLIYYERKDGDSAKYYFTKALEMAYELEDNYLITNMLINLGGAELDLLNNIEDAKRNFLLALEAIDNMEKTNTHGSAALSRAYASLFLGQIMVQQKDYIKAKEYFSQAEKLAESIPNNEILQHLFPHEASLAELRGNAENAVLYYKKYVQLIDKIKTQDSRKNTVRMIFEQQKKYELELQEQEKQLLQEKSKSKELRYILILVAIFSLLAGTVTLARLFWLRAKRRTIEQELTLAQKQKLEQELYIKKEELDFKKRELSTFMLEMARKNNLIKNVAGRLKDIQNNSATPGNKQIDSLANEISREEQSKVMKEFEIRFNEVHTDFYKRLSTNYPDLTAGDLRLCAFLRLHMSIKEICSITFQSPESLKTARYRLRRKLDLSKGENLVNFLSKF